MCGLWYLSVCKCLCLCLCVLCVCVWPCMRPPCTRQGRHQRARCFGSRGLHGVRIRHAQLVKVAPLPCRCSTLGSLENLPRHPQRRPRRSTFPLQILGIWTVSVGDCRPILVTPSHTCVTLVGGAHDGGADGGLGPALVGRGALRVLEIVKV